MRSYHLVAVGPDQSRKSQSCVTHLVGRQSALKPPTRYRWVVLTSWTQHGLSFDISLIRFLETCSDALIFGIGKFHLVICLSQMSKATGADVSANKGTSAALPPQPVLDKIPPFAKVSRRLP